MAQKEKEKESDQAKGLNMGRSRQFRRLLVQMGKERRQAHWIAPGVGDLDAPRFDGRMRAKINPSLPPKAHDLVAQGPGQLTPIF